MHCLMHCLMHWLDALLDPWPPFTFCRPQAIVDQDAEVSIPNSSPFSRSPRFPFTYRFAARVPCDSKGSECQCGIHTAEAASALRSRKTERAAKEKPTPISQFFLAPAAPGTPTRRHALGRLPTPPPLPENLLLRLHRKLPSAPLASSQEVRNPKIRQQLGAQPTPRFRVMIEAMIEALIDPLHALHFLLPTGDSRSGRRSFDSKHHPSPARRGRPSRADNSPPAAPPRPPASAPCSSLATALPLSAAHGCSSLFSPMRPPSEAVN